MGSIHPFWVCPTSRPSLACPWAVSEASHIVNHVSASHISQGNQNMTTVQLLALQEKLVYSLLDIKGAGPLALGSPAAALWAITWHHETGGQENWCCHAEDQVLAVLLWIITHLSLIDWVSLSTFSIYGVMARQLACLCLFWSLVTFCNSQQDWSFSLKKGVSTKSIQQALFNSEMLEIVSLRPRIRQRCLLSPYLFTTELQFLARAKDKEKKCSIKIRMKETNLSLSIE